MKFEFDFPFEDMKFLEIGFELYTWTVKLSWQDEKVIFDKGWYFVKELNL